MKLFLLVFWGILFFCTSYGQKPKTPKENYNCVRKSTSTFEARLEVYPFNISKKIALVSFDVRIGGLPRDNDTICTSHLKEFIVLNPTQIDSLTDLLYNISVKGNVFKFTPATCYSPRNGILFFDSGNKIFEYIEICFECRRIITSSPKIDNGISCEQKFQLLKSYFAKQGIKYGTSDNIQ